MPNLNEIAVTLNIEELLKKIIANYNSLKGKGANRSSFITSLEAIIKKPQLIYGDQLVDISCFNTSGCFSAGSPKALEALIKSIYANNAASTKLDVAIEARLSEMSISNKQKYVTLSSVLKAILPPAGLPRAELPQAIITEQPKKVATGKPKKVATGKPKKKVNKKSKRVRTPLDRAIYRLSSTNFLQGDSGKKILNILVQHSEHAEYLALCFYYADKAGLLSGSKIESNINALINTAHDSEGLAKAIFFADKAGAFNGEYAQDNFNKLVSNSSQCEYYAYDLLYFLFWGHLSISNTRSVGFDKHDQQLFNEMIVWMYPKRGPSFYDHVQSKIDRTLDPASNPIEEGLPYINQGNIFSHGGYGRSGYGSDVNLDEPNLLDPTNNWDIIEKYNKLIRHKPTLSRHYATMFKAKPEHVVISDVRATAIKKYIN